MPPLTRKARTKRETPARPRPATPILVTGRTIAGSVLTLFFDQPVSLSGVPNFLPDVGGVTPVSAAAVARDAVAITYSGSLAGAVVLDLGFQDPAIRNASGGYVTATTFML
jgi:hypothetical protein